MEKRVCLTESLYPLMFYLLISTEKQIKDTIFIVDYRIEVGVRSRLPHVVFEDINKKIYKNKNKWIRWLYGNWLRKTKFHFMKKSEIFGLDFKWYLLHGLRMNYIEDAPNIFNLWETSSIYRNYLEAQNINKWKKMLRKFIFGAYFRCPVATSDGVKCVYTTAYYDKTYLRDKQICVVDLKSEWEKSSEEKKKMILSIFDISDNDLETLKTKKVMLLTQAFYDDKWVTEDEQIEIYRQILENYRHEDVIIKPHPRDQLDYKKYFPDVLCFDKVVPLQFLSILGVRFAHVATVTSSSALAFGDEARIDWYGGGVHPGILKAEGNRTLEDALRAYREQHKR